MASALVGLGIIGAAAMARGGFANVRYPSQVGGGAVEGELVDVQHTGAGRNTNEVLHLTRVNGELRAASTNVMNDPYVNSIAMSDPVLEGARIRAAPDFNRKGSKGF